MRRALLAFWDSGILAKSRDSRLRSSSGASFLLRLHRNHQAFTGCVAPPALEIFSRLTARAHRVSANHADSFTK